MKLPNSVPLAENIFGPYPEYDGPKAKAHIDAKYTWPDHFAHNNYERGHLPQVCIIASGWKARLLGFIFNAK